MERQKWIERKFPPVQDESRFSSMVDALADMPGHLHTLLASLPDETSEAKPGGKWSLKEEAGHLSDLEPLWLQRVDEFISGAAALSPADMSNLATEEAGHNGHRMAHLLDQFAAHRARLVARLRSAPTEVMKRNLLHPRLKTPMRLIDLVAFVVEHDAHHRETMMELMKQLQE